ncbi:hypothetical protein TELCIR_03529 [Teladorsagia circumcincta]|uniref:Uncharacterized protein n=1 Tax=Teladorsagia circumcincta TaxID=45464 RepID=A0A2G9UW34_TELCI|nr:hypothetical protein TELCIR_03529 [Teladorsagia circumcincta]
MMFTAEKWSYEAEGRPLIPVTCKLRSAVVRIRKSYRAMSENDSFANEFDPLCAQYETYTTARFVFITLATVIACLGTAANLLLIHIFSFKKSLFVLYYMYIIPAYVASRVTQLAIPYMLIFATLERLVWTSGNIRSRFLLAMLSTSGRYFTAIISLLVCVALRLPTAFAIEVAVYPHCDDFFRTMTTQPSINLYELDRFVFAYDCMVQDAV